MSASPSIADDLVERNAIPIVVSAIGRGGHFESQLQAAKCLGALLNSDPTQKPELARRLGADLLDLLLVSHER